ncbi:MAG: DUF962 domain-containing protein [Myxococcales bacterium]|nr:DUF962 domain-containing protein [Myxococcales bacterium]MCB9700376.1 DUF962 domain-containing protein [Myxococcales bacterium]
MDAERIAAIDDVWTREFAYYLNEHRHPLNRLTHLFGIPILVVSGIVGIAALSWRIVVAGQVIGWAIQILGHRIEGNRPALLRRKMSFVMGPVMVGVELLERLGLRFAFAERARRILGV